MKYYLLSIVTFLLSVLLLNDIIGDDAYELKRADMKALRKEIKSVKNKTPEQIKMFKEKLAAYEKKIFPVNISLACEAAHANIGVIAKPAQHVPETLDWINYLEEKYLPLAKTLSKDSREHWYLVWHIANAHWVYGHQLRYANKMAESCKHFERAMELYPEDTDQQVSARSFAALNCYWLGDRRKAVKLINENFTKYKEMYPDECARGVELIYSYCDIKNKRQLKVHLSNNLIEHLPDNPYSSSALITLALDKWGQGETEDAMRLGEKSLIQAAGARGQRKRVLQRYAEMLSYAGDKAMGTYYAYLAYVLYSSSNRNSDLETAVDVLADCYYKTYENTDGLKKLLDYLYVSMDGKQAPQEHDGLLEILYPLSEYVRLKKPVESVKTGLEALKETKEKGNERTYLYLLCGNFTEAFKEYSGLEEPDTGITTLITAVYPFVRYHKEFDKAIGEKVRICTTCLKFRMRAKP